MALKDIDNVYKIGNETKEFAMSNTTKFWNKRELKRWINANGDDVLLVAQVDNKLAGFTISTFHAPTKIALFNNIVVLKKYRGLGVGKMLVMEVLNRLRKKGATYVYAEIKNTNEGAKLLFEKLGFKQGYSFVFMEKVL